jgi:choline dehydrogenase-like flavoprotein
MEASGFVPEQPEREEWDLVVVGTGMGGSTVGYELARLGRRVLFLEKGKFLHGGIPPSSPEETVAEARLREGHWPEPLRGRTSFGEVEFFAPLGCGSAGTTAIFGAQLERFNPADFRPSANFPEVRDASLPEEWPISYDELVPYYRRAEKLYRVCGTPDPLNPDDDATLVEPPPLSDRHQVLHDAFVELGLHPYRSHVGFRYVQGCLECDNLCPLLCKSDAGTICLLPALTRYDACILPECEVLELVANGSRVESVRAQWRGREITLRARSVALAAGAFMTPLLLLNSRSAGWPDGLANRSGLVGRNLMLHASDFVTIAPREWYSSEGPKKATTLNDFYSDGGRKLGALQSVAAPLEPVYILAYLRYAGTKDPHWWRKLADPVLPRFARTASRFLTRASLFATILEDLPYPENRVLPDPKSRNGMRFEYRYTPELRDRNRHFRRLVKGTLSPKLAVRVVTGGSNNINYGHVCGTCRFGSSHEASVLDPSNRAHDVDNLYVVDASFLPSSGGINPSLTVAANALRVAGILNGRLS